jgi:hypothetical protein
VNWRQNKNLEQVRGFFVHLQRTYPVLTPFLKGMHLTLDGWREFRDEDMWALPRRTRDSMRGPLPSLAEAPSRVSPAPCLKDDLYCLSVLLQSAEPPVRLIRATQKFAVIYGFADASSTRFGSSFALPDGTLYFRHGVWGPDVDSDSSNFKELNNLVDSIQNGINMGELKKS